MVQERSIGFQKIFLTLQRKEVTYEILKRVYPKATESTPPRPS